MKDPRWHRISYVLVHNILFLGDTDKEVYAKVMEHEERLQLRARSFVVNQCYTEKAVAP